MTTPAIGARKGAVLAAMAVAEDIANGRLSPAQLDAAAVDECRALFRAVVGPDDPLWDVQGEVTRGYLAAGGIPANELQEWLAVQRQREPAQPVAAEPSWIEQGLALMADDEPVSEL